ncbi:MAG TPA: phosphatase PAP2 family protein [Ktedonosporobacter sp.]|jgi:undecaprenyl-diphosphatase|nr:phosphatase PAP2 family protein [Ktedonosporobacter sp.]
MSLLIQWNYLLFQAVNAPAGRFPWLDAWMIFCANVLIFFWPLLLLMVWGIPMSWRRRTLRPEAVELLQERRAVVLWVAIACLIAYALNLLIEQFVFEPRPFVSHQVHLLITHSADASFPSDHTAWSFAVVGMLLWNFLPRLLPRKGMHEGKGLVVDVSLRRQLWAFLTVAGVMGCAIGVARVFVGVHYPDDIVAGAFDGLLGAYVVTRGRYWLSRPARQRLS